MGTKQYFSSHSLPISVLWCNIPMTSRWRKTLPYEQSYYVICVVVIHNNGDNGGEMGASPQSEGKEKNEWETGNNYKLARITAYFVLGNCCLSACRLLPYRLLPTALQLASYLLIRKLSHYGIRGTALQWFIYYLTNRKQYVSISKINSKSAPITCRAPEGSVLGPLLFLILINDVVNISKITEFILFADDTNLLLKIVI